MQVWTVVSGKAAVMASGKPFSPSTTAIRQPADLALRHATSAHGFDQIIDGPRRDAMDVGFLDHSNQGLLRRAAWFEEAGEVAALPQLRDLQRDAASARVPVPVAVSVSLGFPHRRARTFGRARPPLDLCFHDPLGRKGQHLAHKLALGLLLNQFDQRHSVIGHRHLRLSFQVSQPEPSPKIDDDRQRHPRPPAELRQGLRERPPTPPPGTLPH